MFFIFLLYKINKLQNNNDDVLFLNNNRHSLRHDICICGILLKLSNLFYLILCEYIFLKLIF